MLFSYRGRAKTRSKVIATFARRVRECLLSQLNPLDFIPWKPSNGVVRSLSQSMVTSSGTDRWNQKTRRHGQLIPGDTNVGFTPNTRAAPTANNAFVDHRPANRNYR